MAETADRHPVLLRIYLREGGCCAYCGRVLHLDEVCPDHDYPGAAWQELPESELLAACAACYRDKGSRTRAEYRVHRRMLHAREVLRTLARAGA